MTTTTTISTPTPSTGALRAALARLFATDDALAPGLARVALGAVILPHGLQKTLGLFGGYGFEGTMGFFTETMGLPWIVGFLVIAIESVGALALLAGFASRLAALGVAAVMTGAVLTSHLAHGFFMNWDGSAAGEGFEYHLLALALAAIVVIGGGGRASIDRHLAARRGAARGA